MRIRKLEYYAAEDLGDALALLQEKDSGTKLLAGGTDLVLALKQKNMAPSRVISLGKVRELDYLRCESSQVRIGALTTISTLAENEIIQNTCPILSEAAGLIGSWQVRNVATVGGNLCTASPAADSAAVLLALDARVVIADAGGESEIPLSSFFTGPGETVLKPDQLLKEIIIPIFTGPSSGRYLKHMRRKAVDLALVGVAFSVVLDEAQNQLERVSIGLGGVAPTPMRASAAEAILVGLPPEKAVVKLPQAAQKAVEAANPISDVRASASYRCAIVEAYVQRAGEQVLGKWISEAA